MRLAKGWSVLGVLIIIASYILSTIPIHADKPDTKFKHLTDPIVGTKVVPNKYTTDTYLGRNNDNKEVWNSVITVLPQYCEDLKTKINPTWISTSTGFDTWETGANLFRATVDKTVVTITYQNKIMTLDPKVKIGGNMAKPISVFPKVLSVDPINSYYKFNTLEWDYGYFIRHVRVIEGEIFQYLIFNKNPNWSVDIGTEYKDNGYKWENEVQAWDSNGNRLTVNGTKISNTEFNRKDISYPVIIDPTSSFTTSASDGYWYNGAYTSYNSAWTAANVSGSYSGVDNTWTLAYLGQSYGGSNYVIYRSSLYFDTASLSGRTISGASINLYVQNMFASQAFSIQVQNGMPTYPSDPMVSSDYNKSNYSGDGGTLASSSITKNAYNTITLNSTGYGWINTSGTTKFVLRSSRDVNGNAPANGVGEYLAYYTYEQGTGVQPYLSVTYLTVDPSIVSNAASDISLTGATLNATISSDGGDTGNVQVRFGYGTSSQSSANFNSYTTITSWSGTYSTGQVPQYVASSLNSNTTYYYRAQAKNSTTNVITTVTEQSFQTLNGVNDVTGLTGKPTDTSVTLTWNTASGASTYVIRYSLTSYPATTSDGIQIYNNISNTYIHNGLTAGTSYYYSVWGLSGANYSTNPNQLMVTTNSALTSSDPSSYSSNAPTGWLTNTDYTNLSNIPLLYDIVNGIADGISMPYNTAWLIFGVALAVALGIITYATAGQSLMGALVVILVIFTIEWAIKMTPLYFPALSLIAIISTITVRRQFG